MNDELKKNIMASLIELTDEMHSLLDRISEAVPHNFTEMGDVIWYIDVAIEKIITARARLRSIETSGDK